MKGAPRLTVIVPFHNERQTLRTALERLLKVELRVPVEVLAVDDGSDDGSAETIADLMASGSVRLIRGSRNRGKGAAVRAGLARATGNIVTVLDADLEYDPSDYRDLLRPILDRETRVAYGVRSFKAHTAYSFWYVIGNRVLGLWASFLFNGWVSDVETCFKMADAALWRALNLRSDDFGIEAEVTGKLLGRGHRIYEIPVSYRARGREEGKKLRWTDGVQALWILLRIRLLGR